jgi:hypothetical protein
MQGRRIQMNRIFWVTIVLVLLPISSGSAQFLGQLSAAPTLDKGDALWGTYLGVYDNAFALFGQFRYGVVTYVDLGLKLGMINYDPGLGNSRTGLTLGGDIKYWFMEKRSGDPLDISFGVGTEYLSISDFNVLSLGGNVIASYPIDYYESKRVTPYGRLNVRWQRTTLDKPWADPEKWNSGNSQSSDMNVALALGAELKLTETLNLVGELEIDDNVGFVAGINYNIF